MKEDLKILEEFIRNYKEVQEKYKDDEIQAEIERSCYFEEIPAKAIENLIKGYKKLEAINKIQEYRINVIDEREFIPKLKVIEKIKKYNEIIYYAQTEEGMAELKDFEYEEAKYGIQILVELLQEGDK